LKKGWWVGWGGARPNLLAEGGQSKGTPGPPKGTTVVKLTGPVARLRRIGAEKRLSREGRKESVGS